MGDRRIRPPGTSSEGGRESSAAEDEEEEEEEEDEEAAAAVAAAAGGADCPACSSRRDARRLRPSAPLRLSFDPSEVCFLCRTM